MKRKIELTVNDELWELEIEPHRTLLEVLREDLGLTGFQAFSWDNRGKSEMSVWMAVDY